MPLLNNQSDNVEFLHPEYVVYKNQVDTVTNIFNGVDTAKQYIEQATRESNTSFESRRNKTTLKNFVKRATEAFVGMIFRKQVETIGFSDTINPLFTRIDTKNTIQKFSRDLTTSLIRDSKVFIIVDTPIGGGDPYMAIINRANVTNWRKDSNGNYEMIVVYEVIDEAYGDFGIEQTQQWRVFRNDGSVEIWRKDGDKKLYVADIIQTEFDYIPVVAIELEDIPVLYDIAKLNIKHMNRTSFKDKYLDMAAIPVPVVWGAGVEDSGDGGVGTKPVLVIGVDEAFVFSGTKDEADFQWRELTGNSIKALQDDLAVIEEDITSGVIRAATSDTTTIKTATQSFYEAAESANRVTVIASLVEIGLNKAIEFAADMLREELPDDARIIVNKDFNAMIDNSQNMRLLWEVYMGGALSIETLLNSFEQSEIIDIGSVKNEIDRIKKDEFEPKSKEGSAGTTANMDNRTISAINGNQDGDNQNN